MSNASAPHVPWIVANLDLEYINPTTFSLAVSSMKKNYKFTPEELKIVSSEKEMKMVKKLWALMTWVKKRHILNLDSISIEEMLAFHHEQAHRLQAEFDRVQEQTIRSCTLQSSRPPYWMMYSRVDASHNPA